MAKEKEFDNILNECLDRLMKGEDINLVLAEYPEQAAELGPLLKTALEARLTATLQPRAEFRQRAANEFQSALRNLPVKQQSRGASKWQLRWIAPVAAVIVILAGGAGTVAAATNSLPDSPLYGIKKATEAVQVAFTFSDTGKAELYARFVDYRVEEIVQMSEKGELDSIEQATERMNGQLLAMSELNFNGTTQGEKAGTFGLMNGENPPMTQAAAALTAPTTTATATTTAAPAMTTMVAAPSMATPPPVAITSRPASAENQTPATTTSPATTLAGGTTPESGDNAPIDTSALTDIEKLKLLLLEKMEQNLQTLRDQLEKTPEALKPALLEAIEIVERGYWQAIVNLG